MTKKITVPMAATGIYAAVAFFLFAAAVSETLLVYPNTFRDIPESLALTQAYMSTVGVGDLMRPLGAAVMCTGLVATAVAMWYRIARRWAVLSLVTLITGQALLSMLYLWPRASILFDDRAQYTLDQLERAAGEFVVGQYFRLAAAALSALFAVLAALECYRAGIRATTELR